MDQMTPPTTVSAAAEQMAENLLLEEILSTFKQALSMARSCAPDERQ